MLNYSGASYSQLKNSQQPVSSYRLVFNRLILFI